MSCFFFFFFLDKPGPPGQPEPLATADDAITLQWSRPINDGGSPIQGYVLEKREEGDGDWSKCSFGLLNDTQYRVSNYLLKPYFLFNYEKAIISSDVLSS